MDLSSRMNSSVIASWDSTTTRSNRKVIVANMLPLHARKDEGTNSWKFNFDEDSPLWQLKDGFSAETEVFYVGSLKADIDAKEHEEVAEKLLHDFNCVPTFLPDDLHGKFYHGFCKHYLWTIFHYMLPMCRNHSERFDDLHWHAYVAANKIFAEKILEVANPEEDYIWIHDYHLMMVPTYLRRRYYRAKLGFFLHSPFPSSEIYRTLPVRNEILRGLLNCDLIGFQIFAYARHFLSCCSRILGLDYEYKRGHVGLDYNGRTVSIKILPVGVHMGRLESVLNHPSTSAKVKELQDHFRGKEVILGVDDLDLFKGISLKLLAFEELLKNYEDMHGRLVLVQIVNPARISGNDIEEVRRETYLTARRINEVYGSPDYKPVILIDHPIDLSEKSAYYAVAECCVVTAVRDGMNLVPYKYTVCRQGSPVTGEAIGNKSDSPRASMLVVSEFIGCSPSLSGAIRVNPWNTESVADAMYCAVNLSDLEKQTRHERHYQYVRCRDVAYWSQSFMQDMERSCKDYYDKRCWGMGLDLCFRVVTFSPGFRKLSTDYVIPAYGRTNRRAIFLDFDGTIASESSADKTPSYDVISALNGLCGDPRNTVFIVSGRAKNSLSQWLAPCEGLGIAAEHGYFMRWRKTSEWQSIVADLKWKEVVEPIMEQYTEATDGSNIEIKETALVWHYRHAPRDFGSFQAREMLNHLREVLVNERAVVVTRGNQIVEAKPKDVTKGWVTEKVLSAMCDEGKAADFILCIGDDKSDENMFTSSLMSPGAEVFPCTVGQKPSKAKYYLDGTSDVQDLLQKLAHASSPNPV